jgi:chemotaxis protein histidine kinase CheA
MRRYARRMDEQKTAIRSFHENDPDLMDDISEFVVRLAETVDELQDAEADSAWDDLQKMASTLATDAERFGYPGLAQIAHSVTRACSADKQEEAEAGLVELTDMAQRIRLGHRGAA